MNQLRMHYMVYWWAKQLLNGREYTVALGEQTKKMRLFIPGAFMDANLGRAETDEVLDIHVLAGLARHDLIGEWGGGPAEAVRQWNAQINEDGFFVTPTMFGVELFLWAHGLGHVHVGDFLDEKVVLEPLPDYVLVGSARHAPDMTDENARLQRQVEAFVQRTVRSRRRDF